MVPPINCPHAGTFPTNALVNPFPKNTAFLLLIIFLQPHLTLYRSIYDFGFHLPRTPALNFPKKTNNPNPSPIGNKFGLFLFGPSGENRTHGLLNPIQARYQNCATPGYRMWLIAHSSISIPDAGCFVKRFFKFFRFLFRFPPPFPQWAGCGTVVRQIPR